MITVRAFADFAALRAAAPALARDAPDDDIFLSAPWFRTVLAHAMRPGDSPLFLLAEQAGGPAGLLALRTRRRRLESLTTPYSCAFAPVLDPALGMDDHIATCAAMLRACRPRPILRMEALDPDDPRVVALLAGARAAGFAVRRFHHFGNWYEPVAGLAWADYLAQRPGPLRNTIRRKQAAAARGGGMLSIVHGGPDLEAGIAAYEDVYARSWKQAEPFPDFNAAMMHAFAPLGQLRLGLMHLGGRVVAAQIWLLAGGTATVVKLAHDDATKTASPGTVLTAHMLRHLLDVEHVRAIDFGRGDDPYKQGWASQRRQKIGALLLNPRRPTGLAILAWQSLTQALRPLTRGIRIAR